MLFASLRQMTKGNNAEGWCMQQGSPRTNQKADHMKSGLVGRRARICSHQFRNLRCPRNFLFAFVHRSALLLSQPAQPHAAAMAPKTAEKKVATKAVATKKGGKKGGKKKGVESWKIYIYKVWRVCRWPAAVRAAARLLHTRSQMMAHSALAAR